MKTLRNFIKGFVAHAVILSLLQTTFVTTLHAASYDTIEQTGKEAVQVLGSAVNVFGQVKMQQMNMQQQLAQQVQNSKLMSQLSPTCRKADGTLCYVNVGKLFPECPLPASMATLPQNVCTEAPGDPRQAAAQISAMDNYEAIANNWMNHYDQMLNVAANTSTPIGLKCLDDKKKAVNSQLTEMVNNLTRLQDQLNKDKETFKANNKKILEEIALANDELLGAAGTGKNNLKLKTTDFSKYFSATCQSVIGEAGLAVGPKDGLIGVMQSLSPMNKRAADFNSNKASIESEIRNDLSKMQTAIKNGGLQDFLDGKIADVSKYQSLIVATQKQAMEFKLTKDRISKELAKVNYEIPTMDKTFSTDFNDEVSGIAATFQSRYVNACTMGSSSVGIAIPLEQLLNKMVQSNGTAGARDQYKAAIINAMNSGNSMERIVTELQGLEASTYKDMVVTYQDSTGQMVTSSPATILTETYRRCEASYANNEKKKSVRAENLMRELKLAHDTFSANLGTKILEQTLNCNGETKKSGSTCGTPDSFDHTSKNFCISHAQQCAAEVNGCFTEANKLVDSRKAKMESLAKVFNANATAMVARSNQLYTAQKTAVMDMIKMYQTRFPGTNFEVPENMFVSMPELKTDSFGIPLAGDGNMAFMDDLPKKIELMKKMFRTQQEKVEGEIQDYIAKQNEAMEKQKERWKQFGDQCKSMASTIRKDLNKLNADGMKAQQQLDNKVGSFCKKYSDLKSNPLSACNNDPQKLAEDADAIAARLTNSAQYITTQFRNVCNQYNNESSSALEACDEMDEDAAKKSPQKKKRCEALYAKEAKKIAAQGGSVMPSKVKFGTICKTDETTDKELISAVAKTLSDSDKKILEDVNDKNDLKEKYNQLESAAFFKQIFKMAGEEGDACKALSLINETDIEEYPTKKEIADYYDKKEEKIRARAPASTAKADTSKDDKATVKTVESSLPEAINNAIKDNEKERQKALDKLRLNTLVASLSPSLTQEDVMNAELTRIGRMGEQSDQACDAQNSTQQVATKSFGESLMDFDRSILNQQKAASQK